MFSWHQHAASILWDRVKFNQRLLGSFRDWVGPCFVEIIREAKNDVNNPPLVGLVVPIILSFTIWQEKDHSSSLKSL